MVLPPIDEEPQCRGTREKETNKLGMTSNSAKEK
jgi:hypothetical protein